jgi:hypothetical protein
LGSDRIEAFDDFGLIQSYLIKGRQDLAYQVAVSIGAWPTVLIIASLTSAELYASSVTLMLQNTGMNNSDNGFISQYPALGAFLGICSGVDPQSILDSIFVRVNEFGIPEFLGHWRAVLSVLAANRSAGDVPFLLHFSVFLYSFGIIDGGVLWYQLT